MVVGQLSGDVCDDLVSFFYGMVELSDFLVLVPEFLFQVRKLVVGGFDGLCFFEDVGLLFAEGLFEDFELLVFSEEFRGELRDVVFVFLQLSGGFVEAVVCVISKLFLFFEFFVQVAEFLALPAEGFGLVFECGLLRGVFCF